MLVTSTVCYRRRAALAASASAIKGKVSAFGILAGLSALFGGLQRSAQYHAVDATAAFPAHSVPAVKPVGPGCQPGCIARWFAGFGHVALVFHARRQTAAFDHTGRGRSAHRNLWQSGRYWLQPLCWLHTLLTPGGLHR